MNSVLVGHSIHEAGNVTIAAVHAFQHDVSGLILASHINLGLLEADTSWLVFIDDQDLALGVIAREARLCDFIEQLNLEGFIWLPLGVINNSNLNLTLFLFGVHREQLVLVFVVLAGFRRLVNGPHPESEIFRGFLFDGDCDTLVALGYLVSLVLEADSLAVIFGLYLVNLSLTLSSLV